MLSIVLWFFVFKIISRNKSWIELMLLIRGLLANIARQIKNARNSVVIEELVDTELNSKIEKSSFLLLQSTTAQCSGGMKHKKRSGYCCSLEPTSLVSEWQHLELLLLHSKIKGLWPSIAWHMELCTWEQNFHNKLCYEEYW